VSPELWVPGAGGPSLDDLVSRILRTIESYAQRHDVERPHVEVTLHDGTRLALHSLRPEPGFGLVTLCPFPEGADETSDAPPREELIVPIGSIVRIRLAEQPGDDGQFGFSVPRQE